MSEPAVLIAIVGVAGPALLALIGIFGTIITFKLNAAEKERGLQNARTETKLETIHQLTNSNLDKANQRLDKALELITKLQADIVDIKTIKGERASVEKPLVQMSIDPVKVADERVAKATERMAEASEKSADAAVENVEMKRNV